ncbi:hypothetical protein NQ315_010888 [Exocentrus adspersus]|uniref:Anoctamin n=1 Tax=Exocentrus adspersus TaxID=1586481 RepID=A0AAV8VPH3_9CUCU|nr:hypothetical protein NQ315_010888 [Exocentrus adspersus]
MGETLWDSPKLNNFSTLKDAFGPQLDDDSQVTIPGTPLPSLVQDMPDECPPPITPVEKEEVTFTSKLYHSLLYFCLIYQQLPDPESLYFRDGRRKIDMVLVYEEEELGVMTEAEAKRRDRRKVFQWKKKWRQFFEYNHDLIPQEPSFYDATDGADREEQFVVKDRVTSYSSAQRSLIVMQILLRVKFDDTDKTFRTNPVTREKEPYLPAWSKVVRLASTGSVVFFMIFVVLCVVLGTIIYRLSLVTVIYGSKSFFLKKHAKIVTSVSAAVINLIIIMCLTRFYHRIAIYLTNLESPRTQTEYEDSYTFKIFLFEFMNFYSSLIYIAFFKGRFFDYPGDTISRKSEFFRVKGDVCDPAGCLSELCIQLSIIMIGKQIFNNFLELFNP